MQDLIQSLSGMCYRGVTAFESVHWLADEVVLLEAAILQHRLNP